jgi:3-hydroxyacyl-[acyl-carrier-protein] dehydratase
VTALAPARPPGYAAPFAACDEVAAVVDGGVLRVSGVTRIHGEGPYLDAHFPDITIFPGVFVVEAIVQAVAQSLGERPGRLPRLHAVRSLRLLVPLYPGDDLRFQADVTDHGADAVEVRADCRRGDGVRVATMTLECGWSP